MIRDVGAPRAAGAGGVLVLRAPDDAAALRALDRWYRATCRELIRDCLPEAAELVGVEPGKVTVREAKTRWGSCSANGDLSFNWRLALAPEPVLRHVVVHELAHLVHRDHSRRFWTVVERADPATPARRAFLRRHGAELLGYDPGARAPAGLRDAVEGVHQVGLLRRVDRACQQPRVAATDHVDGRTMDGAAILRQAQARLAAVARRLAARHEPELAQTVQPAGHGRARDAELLRGRSRRDARMPRDHIEQPEHGGVIPNGSRASRSAVANARWASAISRAKARASCGS